MPQIEIIGGPRDGTYTWHDDEVFSVTAENHIKDGYLTMARYRLVGGVYQLDGYWRKTMVLDPSCLCARCDRFMPRGTVTCKNCGADMLNAFEKA